ncbi:MAG: LysR family transcriptional regulator [Anaerolineae bacterium]|nr:LysR family transcriptional regulator [Anaerolineae bacterium]
MELKQVEYFLKVVETGSFSAAADELYISQSSLSKQIMALENELGFPLFDRSKRKIVITPAGKTFLSHARNLHSAYQSMLAEVAPYKTVPSLSIIAIPVIAQYEIASQVARFKQANPEVQLALEEREAAAILPALNNRQFDLAFLRDNYLDKTIYNYIEVAHDHFQVILSRQHPLAGKPQLALAQLANENFIMFDKGTGVHELTVDACRTVGFEPRIFYASLRVESILGLVASNSGVALMMKKIFDYHKHPEVVAIPLYETISSNLVLAWPKQKKLSEAALSFVDFARNLRAKDATNHG